MVEDLFLLHRRYANGGRVLIHPLVVQHQEYSRELAMAELAAHTFGWDIWLLPELDRLSPLRPVLLPRVRKGTANPDYLINGVYGDHKETTAPTTPKNLEHRIEEKLRQGDIVLIQLCDSPDDRLIDEVAARRLLAKPRLQKVLIIKADGNCKLYEQKSRS